jgi:TolB protein
MAIAAGVLTCTGITNASAQQINVSVGTTSIAPEASRVLRGGGASGRILLSDWEQSGDQSRLVLFTMRADGTGLTRLTHPGWGYQDMPGAWSPDGRRIAFQRLDPDGYPNIMTINSDGTGLTQLTHCSIATDPCSEGTPTWMPDGKTLVIEHCCFTSAAGYLDGIYTMRADGSRLKKVALNPDTRWGDGVPAVSPDGRWIAFSRFIGSAGDPMNKNVSAMFLVRPDGTQLHQITSYDLMVDEKDWSPDGRRIVFTTHAGSNEGPFRADVFTIRPDGSGLKQLTHTTPGTDLAFFPTWSPDGKTILFNYNSVSSSCAELRTMRSDGSTVRPVGDPPVCGYWPDWTWSSLKHG